MPDFDNHQAASEGWAIFECNGADFMPFKLCRDDESEVFETDGEAWDFVRRKTEEGSCYHMEALAFLYRYSWFEFYAITKDR